MPVTGKKMEPGPLDREPEPYRRVRDGQSHLSTENNP